MYQSFTGASRRPRHVDLSGRKANPWATGSQAGAQSALQNAQHDRQLRQRQREELAAAKTLQRVYRGHRARTICRSTWRQQWDKTYATDEPHIFTQEPEALQCGRLLVSFAQPTDNGDVRRLVWFGSQLGKSMETHGTWTSSHESTTYVRLADVCLRALSRLVLHSDPSAPTLSGLIDCVQLVTFVDPLAPIRLSSRLFETLYSAYNKCPWIGTRVIELLHVVLSHTDTSIYSALADKILTQPLDQNLLDALNKTINRSELLTAAEQVAAGILSDFRRSLWLLGNVVFLMPAQQGTGASVQLMGTLLAAVADRVHVEGTPIDLENVPFDREVLELDPRTTALNPFLQQRLLSLIDENTIRRVLSNFQASNNDASTHLATYVLTLLRVFPQHSDEIRMWLYLGPPQHTQSGPSSSTIGFFWAAARASQVVNAIVRDLRSAIPLITLKSSPSSYQPPVATSDTIVNDWKVVLIFLELYTFVLKIMDDEEFLAQHPSDTGSRTNPLNLSDVAELVIFLKHLGFAMYYYAQQISEAFNPNRDALSKQSLSRAFGMIASIEEEIKHAANEQENTVAGLPGIGLQYVKGIVTGLVRSIYERDSRRKFLPKNQWLMTSEFDMANFISDVVTEEESRHQVQSMEDEDALASDEDADWQATRNMNSNLRRIRDTEKRQRALKKASRRRYLESVAPRLEILQHMPFLIPFDTRVQIFREFVRLDQVKRRNGFIDPDIWRHSLMAGRSPFEAERELRSHHARIRRKHEFKDSMDQFFNLGASLKEPIQITFVDEFDIEEAGIDGGGVTKEFLTSATANAFSPEFGLFKSTGQHLLYPNPTAIEELRQEFDNGELDILVDDFDDHVRWLLNEYEFAGRIIGKCLYEGILVDISFAGFFLNKWAMAGLTGLSIDAVPYRTNINDLRDLDEALYQGLLSLKRYEGNVEDLALTFSITDEIPVSNDRTKTVERDLVPGGSSIPVTKENRLVYISRVAQYRLQLQSHRQSTAFLKGLASIIQPSWLAMFNQGELQNLVGGAASSINIEDLRRNTIYGGLYVIGDDGLEHPCVQLFWNVMHELSDEDKGKVLKFVTSTPRAPLLGFGSLMPKFSIRDSGTDEARFPTTSTCINLLKLPRYKTREALKQKLLYAVNSGAGFDLS